MSKKTSPSMDSWLKEARAHASAPKIGMYLTHNGIVRESAKAKVHQGAADTRPVVGMQFSYNQEAVDAIIAETYKLDGIFYIKIWLNEGELSVGDDIMYVLIGGDIRPMCGCSAISGGPHQKRVCHGNRALLIREIRKNVRNFM